LRSDDGSVGTKAGAFEAAGTGRIYSRYAKGANWPLTKSSRGTKENFGFDRTLSQFFAYIVHRKSPDSASTARRTSLWVSMRHDHAKSRPSAGAKFTIRTSDSIGLRSILLSRIP